MKDREARSWIGLLENYTKGRISSSDKSISILNELYNNNKRLLVENLEFTGNQATKLREITEKFDALMNHLNLEFEDIKPGIRVRKKK